MYLPKGAPRAGAEGEREDVDLARFIGVLKGLAPRDYPLVGRLIASVLRFDAVGDETGAQQLIDDIGAILRSLP